ncbi:MAG TPA: hypothetical protein VFA26_11305, partial [Gemmataceae bacterium]|nr:hypothetical protein [Gemmataceae bacterium]
MSSSRRAAALIAFAALVLAGGGGQELRADDQPKNELPALNRKVVEFVTKHKGEQVGNGQCAVLAFEALKAAGAKPQGDGPGGQYLWGRPLKKGEAVLPGDILQFHDVKMEKVTSQGRFQAAFPLHTAVVVKVSGKGVACLHQNAN